MPHEQLHECDLFLMSSHTSYHANNALRSFARQGSRNIHGWGIGSYIGSNANVVRYEKPAMDELDVSDTFKVAMESISGPIILGHLRLASRGNVIPQNNHPFKLSFLGYEWLMIHNGTARNSSLVDYNERLLLESDNDSARVFEYIRREMIRYYASDYRKSLIESCRYAYASLLNEDPQGKYNIILSNGHLSFAFTHHRPFYLLRREKEAGDSAILSTLKLTENEDWVTFEKLPGKKAKMLVFSGPTLIMNGDVPK